MNRRQFLQSLFAVGALTALEPEKAIEQFLTETELMTDNEFVAYFNYSMNMWITNPRNCAIITNITNE